MKMTEVSKQVGILWGGLSMSEKAEFEEEAAALKLQYDKEVHQKT